MNVVNPNNHNQRSINNPNVAICSAGELFGGVEQFIYSFALYLKNEMGVNLIVILFNKGVLYEKLNAEHIETHVFTEHKYNPLVIRKIADLLKAKKVSIVHTHGYKANILCGIAAKLSKIKIVKTEHGMREPSMSLFHGIKMGSNYFLDKIVSKAMVDSLVFVSRDIEAQYKTTYRGLTKYMIYNAIPAIHLNRTGIPADIDDRAFNIGAIGRLGEVKGHRYLLRAIKRLGDLTDIRLNIFGDGSLKEEIMQYCRENNLLAQVRFLGFKDNIYAYMNKLDMLVMPSLHEGLPYTLLEAMYLKVPIVASQVGGLQEVLEHNVDAILVPPADDEKLADAIRYLHEHAELREALARNAYNKVTANFMIENMATRYLHVYRQCVAHNAKNI